ncbi:16S rRNA (cytosine(1402)-N(4))-methyltransferase RsmH [Coprothermobacter platensis]|uniref:16S rRNA (cytosine(1402)-N(4))-methyltransferase RsmH n=1 Tax=Coprothermobacter platensis TaxID=108819 RepID=UPI00037643BA|nr:16S rRNA (cytosine(1402)-N(4))-methyltransferase RsmH [Coprothermobacter platensis]
MMNYIPHKPVMVSEISQLLIWKENGIYIDGTAGAGGHLEELSKSFPKAVFVGIDIDNEAVEFLREKFSNTESVHILAGNYADMESLLTSMGIDKVDGILLDLGLSTHQALSASRGFSIKNSGPLDMRFSVSQKVTAYDLVNKLSQEELSDIIYRYGEEPRARKIAKDIVNARTIKPLETTGELADLVAKSVGRHGSRIHPATRVFQALRIATNDELSNLERALPNILNCLNIGGRLVIISYHSLEDRVVKQQFKRWEQSGMGERLNKKVIKPSQEEVEDNPSSRSAKVRAFEKGAGGVEE